MIKTFLVVLITAGLVSAQGVDISQIKVRGAGEVSLVDSEGYLVPANLGEMFEVDKSTTPHVLNVIIGFSDKLSDNQRAEVAAMIAAVTLGLKPGHKSYRLLVPTADFVVPEVFIPGTLGVFCNGILQSEGKAGVGNYVLTPTQMVHFHDNSDSRKSTVPQAGWWVLLTWMSALVPPPA